MSSVMLDGWVLSYVFQQLSDRSDRLQEDMKRTCMSNLLTGILLWDNIDWIPASLVAFTPDEMTKDETTDQLLKLLHKIEVPDFDKFKSALPFDEYISSHEKFVYENQDFTELVKRAGFYLEFCSKHGINYFPHPARAQYITKQNLIGQMYNTGVREIIFEKVDKGIRDYYDEVNKKLGHKLLDFRYPVLYDFVRKNTDSPKDELVAALTLRDDKNVVKLRECLNEIDDLFNRGNIHAVDTVISQIEELSKTITNSYSKKINLGELSIGLTPTFNIPIEFSKKDKILNLTFLTKFLTDLLDFSVKDRLDLGTRQDMLDTKKRYDFLIDQLQQKQDLVHQQMISDASKQVKGESDLLKYDVFISHASEDKDIVVKPLYEAIIAKGITAFYDEKSIGWGDSIRKKIDVSLSNSRFAIVVLSKNFFKKKWTADELDGLFAIESQDKLILPLWHEISKNDIAKYSPLLAGRNALKTSDLTFDEIADRLLELLNGDNEKESK